MKSKNDMSQEGEKISFSEGGRINIVFGPKYRTLEKTLKSSVVEPKLLVSAPAPVRLSKSFSSGSDYSFVTTC